MSFPRSDRSNSAPSRSECCNIRGAEWELASRDCIRKIKVQAYGATIPILPFWVGCPKTISMKKAPPLGKARA